jgi:cytochrome c biogenesis protein CcmG, thiol:disulfide interchange protein DsbE
MSNSDAVTGASNERGSGGARSSPSRKLLLLVPVASFMALSLVLVFGLTRNARDLPSALIGRPVPEFALPPVRGRTLGLSTQDIKGEVSLVNVFASWCVACRQEHPFFMELKGSGAVALHGLNYKDRPDDAAAWLDGMGDPYTRTGADLSGRVAIEWGVYGVPETFGRIGQFEPLCIGHRVSVGFATAPSEPTEHITCTVRSPLSILHGAPMCISANLRPISCCTITRAGVASMRSPIVLVSSAGPQSRSSTTILAAPVAG